MNYFEKHIGDYIRDTVSLTMLEDGAYNRLMDQCYQTERPLPLDLKMVYRLARATSTAERKAVDFVVETFFERTPDGYRQKRIQAEIERYQEKQRKAKASADARWSKSKGNANAYGTHDAPDMRTHSVGNAHQTPDTIPTPTEPIGSDADASLFDPPDPKALIFSLGLQILAKAGNPEQPARAFLGRYAKGNEAKLAEVIGYLAANPKIEPKAYIAAAMAPKKLEVAL